MSDKDKELKDTSIDKELNKAIQGKAVKVRGKKGGKAETGRDEGNSKGVDTSRDIEAGEENSSGNKNRAKSNLVVSNKGSKKRLNKLTIEKKAKIKRNIVSGVAIGLVGITVIASFGGIFKELRSTDETITRAEKKQIEDNKKYGEELVGILMNTMRESFTYDVNITAETQVKKHMHEDGREFIGEIHVEDVGHIHEDTGILYFGAEHGDSELEYDGSIPIEYEIHSKDIETLMEYSSYGVNTDSIKLEYIEQDDKKLINNVDVNGIQYINDGIYYSKEKYHDSGLGINRSDYVRGLWYNIIGTGISYGFDIEKEVTDGVTNYKLTSDDVMSIMDIFGYTMYYDEVARLVELNVSVVDGLVEDAVMHLVVDRVYSNEIHTQKMGNKQKLSNFKMEDYNLELDINNQPYYKNTDSLFSPIIVDDTGIPYGAGATAITTSNGTLMVSSELSEEFLEQAAPDAKQLDNNLQYVNAPFNETESAVLVYEEKTGKLVGYKYFGGHIMYDYNSALPYEFIDKYRISQGFISGNNSSKDLLEYRGKIGDKDYTIAIEIKENYPVSIEIMPDELYKSVVALVVQDMDTDKEDSTVKDKDDSK